MVLNYHRTSSASQAVKTVSCPITKYYSLFYFYKSILLYVTKYHEYGEGVTF